MIFYSLLCNIIIDKNILLELNFSKNQSIGTPRSGALRSGAEGDLAGAHPERNSQFIVGAQCGAQLRKLQERNLERNYKICALNQVKSRYK